MDPLSAHPGAALFKPGGCGLHPPGLHPGYRTRTASIAYSILKWKVRYSLHDGLTLDQGLINRRLLWLMVTMLPVEVERTPLMWLCGARRVCGSTQRGCGTARMPPSACPPPTPAAFCGREPAGWTGVYTARLWL